jgi:hypothetical protein
VSDTPRTDRWLRNLDGWHYVNIERARELERELNAANSIIRQQQLLDEENLRLQERIKRLEEAGDLMVQHFYTDEPRSEMWEKAKEAKP